MQLYHYKINIFFNYNGIDVRGIVEVENVVMVTLYQYYMNSKCQTLYTQPNLNNFTIHVNYFTHHNLEWPIWNNIQVAYSMIFYDLQLAWLKLNIDDLLWSQLCNKIGYLHKIWMKRSHGLILMTSINWLIAITENMIERKRKSFHAYTDRVNNCTRWYILPKSKQTEISCPL